jgi:hypothetical protein
VIDGRFVAVDIDGLVIGRYGNAAARGARLPGRCVMIDHDHRPVYIYGSDSVHPIGTIELLPSGRWRAATRSLLIGSTFADRYEAAEAVHIAVEGDAS